MMIARSLRVWLVVWLAAFASTAAMADMATRRLGTPPVGASSNEKAAQVPAAAGQAPSARKPGVAILSCSNGEGVALFDLSALKGAKVYRADLLIFRNGRITGADDAALADIEIYPLAREFFAGTAAKAEGKPLALRGPWFDRFDATEAVRAWLAGKANGGFFVKVCPKWDSASTCLEIAYEGKAENVPPQVKEARAFHRAGQTFITWKEVGPPITADKTSYGEVKDKLAKAGSACRYRIYCSDKPIDARSIAEATLLVEVGPLSAYNINGRNPEYLRGQAMIKPDVIGELAADTNHYAQKWTMDSQRMHRFPIKRFVIDEGAGQLPPDAGLYVHNPAAAGQRYYAVVACKDGVENDKDFGANAVGPVQETVGAGEPVCQGAGQWGPFFDAPGKRSNYVQWCASPLSPLPNMYFNWSILVPPKLEGKAPVELYFHGALGSYAQPDRKMLRHSIQIAPHDWPASNWYGFNDAYGTLKSFNRGVVGNHTHRRIIAFLEWAKTKFPIDSDRIIASGADGAACLVLNYPDMFAFAFVAFEAGGRGGVLNPQAEADYAAIWGPKSPDIKDDKGRADWGWAYLDKLVSAQPGGDLPLFMCNGASWGKIGGYGKGRGLFYNAMEDMRQPLVAFWGWNTVPAPDQFTGLWRGMDIRRGGAVPAITNCSLNTDREADGNYAYNLTWKDVRDGPAGFEITLVGLGKAQTLDLTPRRCVNFKPAPGETVKWEAISQVPAGARPGAAAPAPQSGQVKADANGLVTVPGISLAGTVTVKIGKAD